MSIQATDDTPVLVGVTKDPSSEDDRTPEAGSQETVSGESEAALQEKREASKGVRELGEDRKALLESMLDLAGQSDEAKQALFKALESNERLNRVAEQKFSDQLAILRGEKATKGENLTKEDLKMQAKAELYFDLERKEQKTLVTDLAEKLSMNQEEADSLEKLATIYADQKGTDFKSALYKVARLEKPEHASVLGMPSGNAPSNVSDKPIVNEEDKRIAKTIHQSPEWAAKYRKQMEDSQRKGEPFRIVLDV